jgi:hypothetical protein
MTWAESFDRSLRIMIHRKLTTQGTTSDHLLILADDLDKVAAVIAASPLNDEALAKVYAARAEDARRFAPFFAHVRIPTEPAPPAQRGIAA